MLPLNYLAEKIFLQGIIRIFKGNELHKSLHVFHEHEQLSLVVLQEFLPCRERGHFLLTGCRIVHRSEIEGGTPFYAITPINPLSTLVSG